MSRWRFMSAAIVCLPVYPCSGGSAGYQTTTTPKTTVTTGSNNWVRCRPVSTATVECRQGSCLNGEHQLISPGGVPFYDKTLCQACVAYEQCYDYTKDGPTLGVCQLDYIGCYGTNNIVLAQAVINDTSCASVKSFALLFSRCVKKATGAVICRPDKAACATDENWDPLYYAFSSEFNCLNGILTTKPYIRCVIKDTATCRLQTDGCDSSETKSPSLALFPDQSACQATGPPLYDLCYDFNNVPTYEYGLCQLTDVGCSGVNKLKLLSATPDSTCLANQRTRYLAIRCEAPGVHTNAVCRPAPVGYCKKDGTEAMVPNNYVYPTLESCLAGIFQWCYDYDQADPSTPGICRPLGACLPNEVVMGPTTTDSTCSNVGFTAYLRCEIRTDPSRKCRPSLLTTCKPNVEELDANSPYTTLAECNTVTFNWCYDYMTTTPTYAGGSTCNKLTTCTGTTKIAIGPATYDSTCIKSVLQGIYYRCVDKTSPATTNCRPKEAGCRPGAAGPVETKDCQEFTNPTPCRTNVAIDCQDLHTKYPSIPSSACFLYPGGAGTTAIFAYCDMTTDGGGWTIIQRRFDGSVDFYKTYAEYAVGFGDAVAGEYWLGNDNINKLTNGAATGQNLKIDLESAGATGWAYYTGFATTDSSTQYTLSLTFACASAGVGNGMSDASYPQVNQKFTAKDQDNDLFANAGNAFPSANCAVLYKGGWWYSSCHCSNLNAQYGSTTFGEGMNWCAWKGYSVSMDKTTMKIRRSAFTCPPG